MATSGSFTFDPTFASILDEAAERAGMDPAALTHKHISSAKNSMNYMFNEWQIADGDPLYRIEATSVAVTAGDNDHTMPAGAYDVLDMMIDIDNSGSDQPLTRISRQEWLNISNKVLVGDPSKFYVDHSTLNTPVIYLWPVPEAALTIKYDYMRYIETLGAMSETLDIQRPWLEACVCGLALRLAEKYNMDRVAYLQGKAANSYQIARRAGSGNSRVIIQGKSFGRSRTRRGVSV